MQDSTSKTGGTWANPGRGERDEHHRPGDRPEPEWSVEQEYVVRKFPGRFADKYGDRSRAVAAFRYELLAAESRIGNREPYSPWDTGRRLVVVHAPAVLLPPSQSDPLPSPADALRAVLHPDDFDLIVHGPRVASLLES